MGGVPPPKEGFVESLSNWKEISGRKTWRSKDKKRLYQWDTLHGEFEVYNKRGRHLGTVDENGVHKGDAIKGRSIDV